ncbi:Metallo-beta-lactamase domain protein (fragment) [Candidatus Desulfosporosinus infrequens]|uniref:Metallo-beta-lactamase domain protein n=1 Tax=Candidatus Desulfosporosinus infrequens TaxID=2043169 RepID=A0A2U3LH19_9FIRM
MHLKVISSSSRANGYVLESDTGSLLIECGVSFKKIQQSLDFNLSRIRGCLITHEHL